MNTENQQPQEPTFEERMAPYAEVIAQLKEKLARGEQPTMFPMLNNDEYPDWIAAAALFEEYELLDVFLDFRDKLLATHPDKKEEYDILNTRVHPEFAAWEPTPLYFITGKTAREKMKDIHKMLRYLVQRGADPNRTAGDGSTPLWNQCHADCPPGIMHTLLELGANPNQTSTEDEREDLPLAFCLLPHPDENDENAWLPIEHKAIQKAKMLLQHGADPNQALTSLPNYPPLMLAVKCGIAQGEVKATDALLELIELLLKSGADPNFNNGAPLACATENHYLELGQLLLLYGAQMPAEETEEPIRQTGLKATEDCCFLPPSAGKAWNKPFFFTVEEVLNPETSMLKTDLFSIIISERTADSLTGKVIFDDGRYLKLNAGEFTLNAAHPTYGTPSLNISYHTHIQLLLEWCAGSNADAETKPRTIAELIEMADAYNDAMVPRPATDADLDECNTDLRELGLPELPAEYADFLRICGGFAFNGVELYGTDNVIDTDTGFKLIDVVTASDDFDDHYSDMMDESPLLCFGRQNGDYFTYDEDTGTYQVRSHECISDTWGEYETFAEFFHSEVATWIPAPAEDADAVDEPNSYDPVAKIIFNLATDKNSHALLPDTATAEKLSACNAALTARGLPALPESYAAFLRICNGYAFDGVQFYGTDAVPREGTDFRLEDVVAATEAFNRDYGIEETGLGYPLLCVGWRNGDALTYDPQKDMYQVRDHESGFAATWYEYDTFVEFFMKEVVDWSDLTGQDDEPDEAAQSKPDRYLAHINKLILPYIDYGRLQASYETDMVYAKEVLNALHEAMVAVYGSEQIGADDADGDMVTIPGVLRNLLNGNTCLALFQIDVTCGELWETRFICDCGVVAQDKDDELNRRYIPYNYGYTAVMPTDFHVKHDRLHDAIKAVLADFRNHHATLQPDVNGQTLETPLPCLD